MKAASEAFNRDESPEIFDLMQQLETAIPENSDLTDVASALLTMAGHTIGYLISEDATGSDHAKQLSRDYVSMLIRLISDSYSEANEDGP